MVFLYLDPGAGSLVIQAVLAAVLGIPFLLRSRLAAAAGRLRRIGRRDTDPSADL